MESGLPFALSGLLAETNHWSQVVPYCRRVNGAWWEGLLAIIGGAAEAVSPLGYDAK